MLSVAIYVIRAPLPNTAFFSSAIHSAALRAVKRLCELFVVRHCTKDSILEYGMLFGKLRPEMLLLV